MAMDVNIWLTTSTKLSGGLAISPSITREDVINQILSSIAYEELALSHILNAEAEKIEYILGILPGLSGAGSAL